MKIAALVSGGVDSSVALALLKQAGHDVTAFYLKIWLEDELSWMGDCPWQDDLLYVEKVCKQLDVPLKVVSLQEEYHDSVVSYTIDAARRGRTPNPDIMCNQRIKFGVFLDRVADEYDKVATGHYAQIEHTVDGPLLKQAPDPVKDQTYFLSGVPRDRLSKLLFPIGHLNKEEVRKLAHHFDLPNKDRKDSQGICFLGKIKFDDFLRHHLGEKPGDIVEEETGERLGTHNGYWYHTIGQRKGLELSGGPWYVVKKDTKTNTVFVSKQYYSDDKKRDHFVVTDCNWLTADVPATSELRAAKLRHSEQFVEASVVNNDDGSLDVTLNDRDQGIAPGQYAVFYDGDVCLGGGMIEVGDGS